MKFPNSTLIAGALLALVSLSSTADHNTQEALEKRLAAIGTLNIMTAEEAAEAAAAAAEEAAAAAAEQTQVAAGPVDGESVYNTACMACHNAGIAGAPKVGDSEAWSARMAKGMEVLIENAIQGFQGEAGVMPAKGGNPALTDEEVTAAVQYMVDNSG